MPYKLSKSDGGYKVTSPNHKSGFSKKPMSKEKARKQQAAIYANTHGESFSNRLDAVLAEMANEGMDIYSAREGIKNALANMLNDPMILWNSLGHARELVQNSPQALDIINVMSNLAERWIREIRDNNLMVYDRAPQAHSGKSHYTSMPRAPRPQDQGFEEFRQLYDKYSQQLYTVWHGFDRLMA